MHMKYGTVGECTCDQNGDKQFCEKHIDGKKLICFPEAIEVMIWILAFTYEVPEYDEAEKHFQQNYPSIYNGYILKQPNRLSLDYRVREVKCKIELVNACSRILEEEQLLAEFLKSEEIIGKKRDISLSGTMRDVDEDFERSYHFVFLEYPHLFIQLVEKIEFMPLAIERKIIGMRRQRLVEMMNWPAEKLQKEEESFRAKLEEES